MPKTISEARIHPGKDGTWDLPRIFFINHQTLITIMDKNTEYVGLLALN